MLPTKMAWRGRALAAGVAAACLLGIAPSPAARADVTIAMHMSTDNPILKQLPPGERAQMDKMMQMTTYVGKDKFRTTSTIMTFIANRTARTMYFVNNMSRTYSQMPYNPATVKNWMLKSPADMSTAGYKVVDTGKMSTIMGHKVREYLIDQKVPMQDGGVMVIQEKVWMAQDLPAADMAEYDRMSAQSAGQVHAKGIPIKMVITVDQGQAGTSTVILTTRSISTAPIPASVFAVPSGYTKKQTPQLPGMPGVPGMGAPPT